MATDQWRTPVILLDSSSVPGASIFNGNDWEGRSRQIVRSCGSEFAMLVHAVSQVQQYSAQAAGLCGSQVETLKTQWALGPFPIDKMDFFAEQPGLHLGIEGMLSATKTFLDLVVLLLNTEHIVRTPLNGFNRDKTTYGGRVLNALDNPAKERKEAAAQIAKLILHHKAAWIDQAVWARDQLQHPAEGSHQLMFQLHLEEQAGALVCSDVTPPTIGDHPAPRFGELIATGVREFAQSFLSIVQRPSA